MVPTFQQGISWANKKMINGNSTWWWPLVKTCDWLFASAMPIALLSLPPNYWYGIDKHWWYRGTCFCIFCCFFMYETATFKECCTSSMSPLPSVSMASKHLAWCLSHTVRTPFGHLKGRGRLRSNLSKTVITMPRHPRIRMTSLGGIVTWRFSVTWTQISQLWNKKQSSYLLLSSCFHSMGSSRDLFSQPVQLETSDGPLRDQNGWLASNSSAFFLTTWDLTWPSRTWNTFPAPDGIVTSQTQNMLFYLLISMTRDLLGS